MSDRDKISFSELDKKRREKKREGGARRGGRRQTQWAANSYKRRIDERLFGKKGDAGRQRMAERLRESHGTANLTRIYREYVKGYGMPDDMGLLMLLLELEEEGEALKVIEALEAASESAPVEQKNLLKSRLRNLEMSTSSDALADAASGLLDRL